MPNPDIIVVRVPGATGPAGELTSGQKDKAHSFPVTVAFDDDLHDSLGATNETAPDTDTAAAGINGRLQRIAVNLTNLFGQKVTAVTALAAGGIGVIGWLSQIWSRLDTSLQAIDAKLGGTLAVSGPLTDAQIRAAALPVSAAALPLPSGAATAANQATGNTSLASIDTRLAGTLPVNQVQAAYDIPAPFNRPSDTNPYLAGDVVGGVLTFTGLGPSGKPIMITGAQLEIDLSAIPSGMTSFRLHCYSASPPSALNDNDPWDLSAGDRSAYLGFIDLGSPVKFVSTLYVEQDNINKQRKLADANLYAYLVTSTGYTPAASTHYVPTLHSQAV